MNRRLHEDYITHGMWSITWDSCIMIPERQEPSLFPCPTMQKSWVVGSCDLGLSESASHRVRLGNSPIVVPSQRTDSQGGTKGPENQAREKNNLLGLFSVC